MAGHVPVLLEAGVAILQPRPGGRYLDATGGVGGHAETILRASEQMGTLVGIDRDAEALALARQRLDVFGERVMLLHGRYEYLTELVGAGRAFDGILFDLGASSLQLDTAARGFSFGREGPLDMRMDRSEGTTAADVMARLSEQELAEFRSWFHEFDWALWDRHPAFA